MLPLQATPPGLDSAPQSRPAALLTLVSSFSFPSHPAWRLIILGLHG